MPRPPDESCRLPVGVLESPLENAVPQPFDANIACFTCPKCGVHIREPIGSFRRPYYCYQCGVLVVMRDLADLEREAAYQGKDARVILIRVDQPDGSEGTTRLAQEHKPGWLPVVRTP